MIDENEVTEVTENEQEQIQAEHERQEAEELVWDIYHKNCDKVRISDN